MNIQKSTEKGAGIEASSLFAAFGEKLYNTAFQMCRSAADAEDLTLRTFEQVFRSIHLYDPEKPIFPWLCAILTNCYRMDLRGKGRNALDFVSEPPEMTGERPDQAEVLAHEEDALAVHDAVENLPDRYRVLVVLRYFDELTVPQIAASLNLPEGTVKRRLHEAKELLRMELVRTIRPEGA